MSTSVIKITAPHSTTGNLGTLMELLSLAAQLDVTWYAGSMCRACGVMMPSEHSAACPMPDHSDTRRPLEVAIPGDGYAVLNPTLALATSMVTGIDIATTRRGCVPLARAELRRWARRQS